jgi:3,4-dihydroxy-2-butanone 4-phosphate synthase
MEGLMRPSVSLRRFVGLAKVPAICDIIHNELENHAYDKIVLFAVHQSVIEETR